MAETVPTYEGKRSGELSPKKEWIWVSKNLGWKRADEPVSRAVRKLSE